VNVIVVWATSGVQESVPVTLDAGATVADAVARSGLVARYGLDLARLGAAISGRRAAWQTSVADGDRVELTRPLTADPKEVRRLRANASSLDKTVPRTKRARRA
jgi:putative ubiquitin-RnfH superfamily antitoxin RatB of RatAB toxin-antitoxin module